MPHVIPYITSLLPQSYIFFKFESAKNERTNNIFKHKIILSMYRSVGWFYSRTSVTQWQLPTVRKSSLKMVLMHVVIVLFHHGGNRSPAVVPPEV